MNHGDTEKGGKMNHRDTEGTEREQEKKYTTEVQRTQREEDEGFGRKEKQPKNPSPSFCYDHSLLHPLCVSAVYSLTFSVSSVSLWLTLPLFSVISVSLWLILSFSVFSVSLWLTLPLFSVISVSLW